MQQLFGFAQQAGLNIVRIWAFAPGTGLQTAPGGLFSGVCQILALSTPCVWAWLGPADSSACADWLHLHHFWRSLPHGCTVGSVCLGRCSFCGLQTAVGELIGCVGLIPA